MAGKYAPLHEYLEKLEQSPWRATFRDIEAILGKPLPTTARTYPDWWTNDPEHRQGRAWTTAGWEAEGLDLHGETITFRRVRPAAN